MSLVMILLSLRNNESKKLEFLWRNSTIIPIQQLNNSSFAKETISDEWAQQHKRMWICKFPQDFLLILHKFKFND